YPWQNSWGFSTRSIGGLIMAQSDDQGLILPPKIAPVQVVIIPIFKGTKDKINKYCKDLVEKLSGLRVEIDLKEEESAGFKFNKWEVKGVPLRIEVGQKEIESETVTVVRRDNSRKEVMKLGSLKEVIEKLLEKIQDEAYMRHKKFTVENTREVDTYDEFKEIMQTKRGFLKSFWCENAECEKKIKEESKATTRCLPLDAKEEKGQCIYCGKKAKHRWLFAQSY
ncbi:MAG: hypothetical protein ACD_24C00251G0001, partial [uncultured bacterium]